LFYAFCWWGAFCAFADLFAQELNEKTEYLLRGLRKMHSLEWIPDWEKKQLRKVADLPWCRDFPADSHRIPKDWVENRHKWLDENGKPQMPLWFEESKHSDCLAEMQELSYHKSIGSVQTCAGKAYEQQDVVLECEEAAESLKEILQGEILEMQKEIAQRKSRADPKVMLSSIQNLLKKETKTTKKNKVLKNLKKCADKVLKNKMIQGLKEKMKLMNRHQALQSLVPEAGKNKAKKKKAGAEAEIKKKKKPYSMLKEKKKPHAVKKQQLKSKTPNKKHQKNKSQLKSMMESELKKKNKESADAAVPADPAEALWLGKQVQITGEAAGHLYFGKHGEVTKVKDGVAYVQLGVTLQTCNTKLENLTDISVLKKPRPFKSLVNISKNMKKQMLQQCNLLALSGEEEAEQDLAGLAEEEEKVQWTDNLEVIEEKQEELLAHHIELAWRFMVWALEAPTAAEEMCLEASLAGHWRHLHKQSAEDGEADANTAIQIVEKIGRYIQARAAAVEMLIVPVHGLQPMHWTVLVVEINKVEKKVKACRYYDTLQQEHKDCRSTAEGLLELIQIGFQQTDMVQLPARTNSCMQAGADCGLFAICYLEKELRMLLKEGEGAVPWPADNIKFWRSKLQTVTKSLQKELLWLSEQDKEHAAKKAAQEAATLKTKKGKEALEKQKQYLKELQAKALQLLAAGGTDVERLPEKDQVKLQKIEMQGVGVCPSCRWTSGCFRCSYEKAKRYHLKKFAVSVAKEALKTT